jgi:hypothetical protein
MAYFSRIEAGEVDVAETEYHADPAHFGTPSMRSAKANWISLSREQWSTLNWMGESKVAFGKAQPGVLLAESGFTDTTSNFLSVGC